MDKIIIATVIGLLSATAANAQAACPSRPDNASTRYTQNQVDRTICLQNQISGSTQRLQDQMQYNQQLNSTVRQLEIQRDLTTPIEPPRF